VSCFFAPAQTATPSSPLKLWYDKPAKAWEEALPLGNAKTGAMVFGGVVTERLQLNDNTLWSGFPEAGNNPNGIAILPQVREQVFAGNMTARQLYGEKCRVLILRVIFRSPISG
jgi:alpha-L-fucosidase 2